MLRHVVLIVIGLQRYSYNLILYSGPYDLNGLNLNLGQAL